MSISPYNYTLCNSTWTCLWCFGLIIIQELKFFIVAAQFHFSLSLNLALFSFDFLPKIEIFRRGGSPSLIFTSYADIPRFLRFRFPLKREYYWEFVVWLQLSILHTKDTKLGKSGNFRSL